jgi:hypothetical protein
MPIKHNIATIKSRNGGKPLILEVSYPKGTKYKVMASIGEEKTEVMKKDLYNFMLAVMDGELLADMFPYRITTGSQESFKIDATAKKDIKEGEDIVITRKDGSQVKTKALKDILKGEKITINHTVQKPESVSEPILEKQEDARKRIKFTH